LDIDAFANRIAVPVDAGGERARRQSDRALTADIVAEIDVGRRDGRRERAAVARDWGQADRRVACRRQTLRQRDGRAADCADYVIVVGVGREAGAIAVGAGALNVDAFANRIAVPVGARSNRVRGQRIRPVPIVTEARPTVALVPAVRPCVSVMVVLLIAPIT
jgi:hypothetical protein